MKWTHNALAVEIVVGPLRKNFHTDDGYEEERVRHLQRMKSRVLGLPKAVQDSETIEGLREQGFVGVCELEEEDVFLNSSELELLFRAEHSEAFKALVERLGIPEQMAANVIELLGNRIGVRKKIPCHRCEGSGSITKWEALKP